MGLSSGYRDRHRPRVCIENLGREGERGRGRGREREGERGREREGAGEYVCKQSVYRSKDLTIVTYSQNIHPILPTRP